MNSLLDQSTLTTLAERLGAPARPPGGRAAPAGAARGVALPALAEGLVAAGRRAGADAADAVAERGMSLSVEVRDGTVEASERSEGDNMGLRAFVGRRRAVASTNS